MTERPESVIGGAAKRLGLLGLIATILVALLGFLAPAASASSLLHPQTRVAPIEQPAGQLVGHHETVLPGSGRPRAPSYDLSATGSSVAAEGGAGELGTQATAHGAERLAQAGFTDESIAATKAGQVFTQADGATVYLNEVSAGRYDFIVEGNDGVITAHTNWALKSVVRIAGNYGWNWSP